MTEIRRPAAATRRTGKPNPLLRLARFAARNLEPSRVYRRGW